MAELDILILRLRGPLMAFGDVAVDEIRPTDLLPGLSLLTGLLGNALGYDYTDGPLLQRLQDRLRMASRLDRRGEPVRDYQNAHINMKDKIWQYAWQSTGRGGGGSGEVNVQRYRHYRADAAVTVAFHLLPADEEPGLDALERALLHPARPLFLGRMNCPPSRPLYAGERVRAAGLEAALYAAPPLPGADKEPWLAEVPSTEEGDMLHGRERQDVRQWVNDVHGGARLVRRFLMERQEGGQHEHVPA